LTQVLINLVGNAIKFTDAGEVAIKAEANNGSFYVSVRDTGPGSLLTIRPPAHRSRRGNGPALSSSVVVFLFLIQINDGRAARSRRT
jgi:anti-sigma regulatory factor (Ser/Thr protein kinase)